MTTRLGYVYVALVLSFVTAAKAASPTESVSASSSPAPRPAEGVQDNSFLIEEAYNQEAGVVQHIMNVIYTANTHSSPDERQLQFVFTQEWPFFTQTHQLSYTLPYSFFDSRGRSTNGFNDVLLNYRYQALMETDRTPAFAPRLSLILPTGDAHAELGNGVVGYQTNLPLSKIVSDRVTVHFNGGVTLYPDVSGHDLVSYNLGASAIYAVSSRFNLMLESVMNWNDEIDDIGRAERVCSAVISPGLRYAFNHSFDAQTVIGIAAPIGLNANTPNYGVFLYASFEHHFLRERKAETN